MSGEFVECLLLLGCLRQMQRLLGDEIGNGFHIIHGPTADPNAGINRLFILAKDVGAIILSESDVFRWYSQLALLAPYRDGNPVAVAKASRFGLAEYGSPASFWRR